LDDCEKNIATRGSEQPQLDVLSLPGEIPFEMMVLLMFFPMWIILVPVSAC
jgi:hypothetical protein